MDILDEHKKDTSYSLFKEYDPFEKLDYLSKKDEVRLMNLIKQRTLKQVSLNQYYKNLAEFWSSVGEEDWAEEILLKVSN